MNEDKSPPLTRVPFDGFLDVSDEHRELAEMLAARFSEAFVAQGLQAPTSDHAILSTQMQIFADAALVNAKPSALVHKLFDDKTDVGRAAGLLVAGLLTRLYEAPYQSINDAALDFVNVMVAALAVVESAGKKKPHGNVAKGKRPT